MQNSFPFSFSDIHLVGAVYIDQQYAQNHAHALHQHHDKIELLYVYRGDGRYQIGQREYAVHQGDILICNAYSLHGETLTLQNCIQTYCCALSGLKLPNLMENCLLSSEHRPVISLTQYQPLVHDLMPQIYQLYCTDANDALAEQMARTVLLMTFRELQQQRISNKQQGKQRMEMLVRTITDYLDQHYTDPMLRMKDICHTLHISESYLCHAFKQETGLSPKQYIVLRRIGEAQSLLEATEMPIHEIEEQLGFGSSCHLTSTFKKYVGIAPREYRRHFQSRNNLQSTPER